MINKIINITQNIIPYIRRKSHIFVNVLSPTDKYFLYQMNLYIKKSVLMERLKNRVGSPNDLYTSEYFAFKSL